jgi:hypothetical protein
MKPSLEARILKLERRRQPPEALCFLAWGRDRASAKAAVVEAYTAGSVVGSDVAICGVWPYSGDPLPAPRWIMRQDRLQSPPQEEDALSLMVEARLKELQGEKQSEEGGQPGADRHRLIEMTTAELYAAIFGALVSEIADAA